MSSASRRTYNVITATGLKAKLWSDDTYTLHFGAGFADQVESTPADLAATLDSCSLMKIFSITKDTNDREKTRKALDLILSGSMDAVVGWHRYMRLT